jgi:hypothetical protein
MLLKIIPDGFFCKEENPRRRPMVGIIKHFGAPIALKVEITRHAVKGHYGLTGLRIFTRMRKTKKLYTPFKSSGLPKGI